MATDPSIPLQVRPAQIASPMDAMQRAVTIADSVSQMQQRQRLAPAQNAQAKLAVTQATAAQAQLDDSTLLDQIADANVSYDEAAHDIKLDKEAAAAELQKRGKAHLIPVLTEKYDALVQARRTRALKEIDDAHKVTDALGIPAQSFLDTDEAERPAKYPALLQTLGQVDPSILRSMPAQYDENALAKINEIIDHRQQIRAVGDKLKEAQDRAALAEMKDDELDPEVRWRKYNKDAGPMPLWYRDAIAAKKSGIKGPVASTYVDKKVTAMNGNNVPEDATDREGTAIPTSQRTPETIFEQRQDSNGKLYYQVTKSEAKTSKEKEHARIEKAYAMSIGKKYEDLDDGDRVNADIWHAKLLPEKQTEIDKRLALYERDPETYGALFGHGATGDKPLTAAQKATILGRINTDITRQALTGKGATDFKNARLAELKDAGIDMAGVAAPAPKAKTGYGPTEGRVLNKDMGAHKKGETVSVHKNLQTGVYEEVR